MSDLQKSRSLVRIEEVRLRDGFDFVFDLVDTNTKGKGRTDAEEDTRYLGRLVHK